MTRKEDSNLRETPGPKRSNGGRREEAAAEGPPMRSEVVEREKWLGAARGGGWSEVVSVCETAGEEAMGGRVG